MSGNTPKRTPLHQTMRYLFGIAMIALIIYGLSLIPYEILREERFRLFGEASAVGVVTEVMIRETAEQEKRFVVTYSYVDQDGLPREASAPLPEKVWKSFHKGSRVRVTYALSHPGLSRIKDEIEPPFQLWLRNAIN